jgi:hypothetical protein
MMKSEPMQRCQLADCRAACCLHGVWLDVTEAQDILRNSKLIGPFMQTGFEAPGTWFDERSDRDEHSLTGQVIHSAVLETPQHYGGTACVFLREDHKCALQVAGEAAGEKPWRFKPYYCILHPLDIDVQGRITLDETDVLLDEPGSCLRPSEQPIPLVQTFEPELRHLLGDKSYEKLIKDVAEDNEN